MSSLKRILASRANGARSRGPITAAGKRNSSRNALRHGLCARRHIPESHPGEFEAERCALAAGLRPAGPVESALVDEMAAARLQQRAAWQTEASLLNAVIARHPAADPVSALAASLAPRSGEPNPWLIARYEIHHHNTFHRALKQLLRLRAMRGAAPAPHASRAPNEPTMYLKTKEPSLRASAPDNISTPEASYFYPPIRYPSGELPIAQKRHDFQNTGRR